VPKNQPRNAFFGLRPNWIQARIQMTAVLSSKTTNHRHPKKRAVSPAPNAYPKPKLTRRPRFCSLPLALNFPLIDDNHASN
jgi:hypothetical protein